MPAGGARKRSGTGVSPVQVQLPQARATRPCHPGSVLLVVLVVVAILTLGTATYLQLMQTEHQAARRHGRGEQARRLAESGVEYLRLFLSQPLAEIQRRGGWVNNAPVFKAGVIDEQPDDFARGMFTIFSPAQANGLYATVRNGLEDESAKLNLNTLLAPGVEQQAVARLMALPGMTPEAADAILDWLDADEAPRPYGAESPYYQGLSPSYVARNGPIGDLDELLAVRGVTPELLYGVDQNRNYLADASETPRGALLSLDNSQGQLDRGWSAYLTVQSVEGTVGIDGLPKLDLNGQNLQDLYSKLQPIVGDPGAKFIIAFRQSDGNGQPGQGGGGGGGGQSGGQGGGGPQGGGGAATPVQNVQSTQSVANVAAAARTQNGGGTGGDAGGQGGGAPGGVNAGGGQPQQPVTVQPEALQLDFTKPAPKRINSLLDLVDAQAQLPGANNGPPQQIPSPFKSDPASYRKLVSLADAATPMTQRIAGRLNVNAASRPVLASIPNITPVIVDQIVARRESEPDLRLGSQRHVYWLLVDGIVTLDQMRQLEPYVTTRGDALGGEVVGFFASGPGSWRAQFVVDRSAKTPRLRAWRDLTPLGPGFSRADLGAADAAAESGAKP